MCAFSIMTGYIYVLKLREFVRSNEHVVKIGTTQDILRRVRQYPKGSILLYTMLVNDGRAAESNALQALSNRFPIRVDLGREYFEGPEQAIIQHVHDTLVQHQTPLDTSSLYHLIGAEKRKANVPMEIDPPSSKRYKSKSQKQSAAPTSVAN
jgi:hypothetical protein